MSERTMAKTADRVTAEELAVYQATARQREARQRREQADRVSRARALAYRAARLLKERFAARQVILFGSLARQDFFHSRSDIDLAVAGIKSQDFWRAWSALDTLAPEFELDLVALEAASPALRQELERDGVEL